MKFIENNSVRLIDELEGLFGKSEEIFICTAFIRETGLNLLIKIIEKFIQNGGAIKILFGNDFGLTEREAILTLMEIGSELRYYQGDETFHIKSYIFKQDHFISAIIGSSNISASGLTTGAEWNVLITPESGLGERIYDEFCRLWESKKSITVTDEILDKIKAKAPVETFKSLSQKEDKYIKLDTEINIADYLDPSKNYIVRRRPDYRTNWSFQIYDSKLKEYSKKGEFYIVVICDYQGPSQKIITIPFEYFKENILPSAYRDEKGRYLFEVIKRDLRFNWHHRIGMDGKKFLVA
jgi:HKD family nuclease